MKVKRGLISVIICTCFLLMMAGCGEKKEIKIEAVTDMGNLKYSCGYDGKERTYLEYKPDGDAKGILFMLHGYGSNPESFQNDTGMHIEAGKRGYVVIYVAGIRNEKDSSASSGWNAGIGDSEIDDIGFLNALAKYMQQKYGLTRDDTFAAGYSNGAFMMHRIATEGQESFAAVASVAGMMPEKVWVSRPDTNQISVLQISGSKDDVIPMYYNGSDHNSKNPPMEDVIAYYASANGLTQMQTESLTEKVLVTKYKEQGKKEQVWHVFIEGGRHSWPDEKLWGFNTNSLILDFFDQVHYSEK